MLACAHKATFPVGVFKAQRWLKARRNEPVRVAASHVQNAQRTAAQYVVCMAVSSCVHVVMIGQGACLPVSQHDMQTASQTHVSD